MKTAVKYDAQTLQLIALFERITKAKIKDSFYDPVQKRQLFVVQKGNLWKALGPKSINVKKLQEKLNRKIKIVEFDSEKHKFIKNLVFPLKITDVREENGVITLVCDDIKTRGLLIGRNAANLRNLEENVQRYYTIKEIKVV